MSFNPQCYRAEVYSIGFQTKTDVNSWLDLSASIYDLVAGFLQCHQKKKQIFI